MYSTGRKYIMFLFCLLISLFLLSISSPLKTQQISDNQVKVGYIFNFLKYITWNKENQIDTFKIGIYGDDPEILSLLKNMEKMQVKNKPVRILNFKSIGEIIFCQVLYITNDKNFFVSDIFNLVKGDNTLLVSDRYEYQRYVMINFIYNENSKIQFEINTKNIEEARLKTSPKLVLLGGSEIDVRKLYLETEKSLVTEKEKAESYEKELQQKKDEIFTMNSRLFNLYQEIRGNKKEIDTLNLNIANQKSELNKLQTETQQQQFNLNVKTLILEKQKLAILDQEKRLGSQKNEILSKQYKIENYSSVLKNQKSEIDKRQSIIENQGQTLNNQIAKIKIQQAFLYLLISLTIVTITLIFFIYYNYKVKKKKNLELEQMNLELIENKNEILYQAGQLEIKNVELEKLSLVARETDNAIMIANGQGEFEYINEGFTRMYGYSFDQFLSARGKNIEQASTYEEIKDILAFLNNEKKSISYESPNIDAEGKKIWIHTTITPLVDKNRNIKKLIVIDSDVTRLKEAELDILNKNEEIQRQSEELYEHAEQLFDLNQELEVKKKSLEDALEKLKNAQTQLVESEKMVILGQLTAGIAHEINNPINFINSGIEGLKMAFAQVIELLQQFEQITPENARKKLEEIKTIKQNMDYSTLLKNIDELTKDVKTGVFRTIEIIKGLRTFSRLDESDLKYTDIHKNIDSTLVILRNKFVNRIDIIKNYGNIPEVECYPGKINQVFLNILVNAIQAIPGEGKIWIETKRFAKNEKDFIYISIKDSGIGMGVEVKKRIFEPFYTTKEAGEGTGLGLSISHNIIETHGGIIDVESEVGKGSTFVINLPVVFHKKEKTFAIFE